MSHIANAVVLDASATAATPWFDCRGVVSNTLSLQLVVPAGIVGTVTVEVTNDTRTVITEQNAGVAPLSTTAPIVDFTTRMVQLPAASFTISGAVNLLALTVASPAFLRVKYTRTSGAGLIKVFTYGSKQ